MLRAVLFLAISASSVAFADASKDAVAGAPGARMVHAPKLAHALVDRAPVVKDEPSASKTAPLVPLPSSKLK